MSRETQLNTIYNEDCLETMKIMPDNYVECILTDPPYGIGESAGKNKSGGNLAIAKDYGNEKWDNQRVSEYHIEEMLRVSKNIILFGGNYYADLLPASNCWIVWDKDNGGNDFADCELAYTSFNTAVRKFKWRWNGMLQENMKNKETRYHPTQKPLPLMKWVLENYTKEGDLIYDPFLGSGTTAVACKSLGRNYIGSEISKEYCKIAEKRLEQEYLF